ncbi:TetR/AcrR family transcriptional regulator [Patulibacter minatonensis]|uniref:TetR/AcrR family transcriptional regulator n=1 Tax=Patulibacter minatonensis TaxID=298163 RepID=UPI000479FCCD|nr:TetR/AcrR family transcriptional regulator [Patulibacter minatonensis]
MPVVLSERHEELADQLVELFLAEGFRGLTLGDLTQRLRCSKTTLYALGESKEQLVGNAVVRFFRAATGEVEAATAAADGAEAKIAAYLSAVADALRPASADFIADVAAHPTARRAYARNTKIAAGRVRDLVNEGVASGDFREVHAAFVADTIAATMQRIQSGDVLRTTGLHDAEAYEELARLVLRGIRS